jgi:hypothetical protein
LEDSAVGKFKNRAKINQRWYYRYRDFFPFTLIDYDFETAVLKFDPFNIYAAIFILFIRLSSGGKDGKIQIRFIYISRIFSVFEMKLRFRYRLSRNHHHIFPLECRRGRDGIH